VIIFMQIFAAKLTDYRGLIIPAFNDEIAL